MPYYRGFTFTIYLNYLIKKYNNHNSVDNNLFDLFETSKSKSFSMKYFLKLAQKYIPNEIIKKATTDFIVKGQTIDLTILAKDLSLEKLNMGVFDLGFDREAFVEQKIIKDIRLDSNAYKTGLKDGDKVIKWNFPKMRDPEQVVTITTPNKIFQYRPEHPDKKEIYRFKSNLSLEEEKKIKRFFGVK